MKDNGFYFADSAGIGGRPKESIARFAKTKTATRCTTISVKPKKTTVSMCVTVANHLSASGICCIIASGY
jgi:hypothetical protein